MKFIVQRTSYGSDSDTPPCDEARRETIMVRWYDDEAYEIDVWMIELSTLEELMAFYEKYERSLVIKAHVIDESYRTIEIYDAWRE